MKKTSTSFFILLILMSLVGQGITPLALAVATPQEVPSGVVGCKARPADNSWEKLFDTPWVEKPTLYRLSATRNNQPLGQALLNVIPSSITSPLPSPWKGEGIATKEDRAVAQEVANNLALMISRVQLEPVVNTLLQSTTQVTQEKFIADVALTPLFAFVHMKGVVPGPGPLLKPVAPPPAISPDDDEAQVMQRFQDTVVKSIGDCSFNPKASYQDLKAMIGLKLWQVIWQFWDATIKDAYDNHNLRIPKPRPTLEQAVRALQNQDSGRGYARGIAVPIQTLRILQGLAGAISVWPGNCSQNASWLLEQALVYNPQTYNKDAPHIDIHTDILRSVLEEKGFTQVFALLDQLLIAALTKNQQGLLDALKKLHTLLHATKADFQKDLGELERDMDRILENDKSFPEKDADDTTAPVPPAPKLPGVIDIKKLLTKKPPDTFDPKKGSLEEDAFEYLQCSEAAKDRLKLRMKHEIYARIKAGLASLLKKLYFNDDKGDLEKLLEQASDYSQKYTKGGVVVGMPFIGSDAFDALTELRGRAKAEATAKTWLVMHNDSPDRGLPPEIPDLIKVLGGHTIIATKNEMIVLAFARLLANMKATYLKDCRIKLPAFLDKTLKDTENDIRAVLTAQIANGLGIRPNDLSNLYLKKAMDALVDMLLKIKEIRMVQRLGVRMQRFIRDEENRLIDLKRSYIKQMGTIDPLQQFFIELLKRIKDQQKKILPGVAKK